MPFKSDKQRRYLWSQKPEVAKKFAEHKAMGGPLSPNYKEKGGFLDTVGGSIYHGGKALQDAWSNPWIRGGAELAGGLTPGVGEALDIASGAVGAKKLYDGDIKGGLADIGVAGAGLLIPGVTGSSLRGGARLTKAAAEEWGDDLARYSDDAYDAIEEGVGGALGGWNEFVEASPEWLAKQFDMTVKEVKETQRWAREMGPSAWHQNKGGMVGPLGGNNAR